MRTPQMLPALAGRDALSAYFDASWALTERLFGTLRSDECSYQQPDPLRNPLIFYLGHPAAFYVNKLRAAGLLSEGVSEDWEHRFERGVDPGDASELGAPQDWPPVEDVHAYRRAVYVRVREVIDRASWDRPIGWDDPEWSLLMAFEHERIHFETSSVLFRQLSDAHVERPADWCYAPSGEPGTEVRTIHIPGGQVVLGRPQGVKHFGWDNEYGTRRVDVAPFIARRDLVTNAELLAFTRAGGYQRRELWSEAGWAWLTREGRQHPKFWRPDPQRSQGWAYRAMFDRIDLPLDWPAEVNAHEAHALCRWIGEGWRLPTEAEHALLGRGAPAEASAFNLNLRFGSPTPVGHIAEAVSQWGCRDVRGNVWQWLDDPMTPFEGFRPHPLYADFSNLYFDDSHALMAGGAWASTGTSATPWYRNWFRLHFYQHAGFRPVNSRVAARG